MKRIFGSVMAAALVLSLVAASCGGKKDKNVLPQEVSAAKAIKRDISKTVFVTGSVEAENFAQVFPRGPGKVLKKFLKDGDAVKKDQTIMTTRRDEVGYSFKPAPVVAPIDGFVGRITVDVGDTVVAERSVATVVQPDMMRIKVDVPEQYLSSLTIGYSTGFSVDALPGKRFEATVTSVSREIDLKNRTFRVELGLDNPDHKLAHGMFAQLSIPVETHKDAIVVPIGAISWEADRQFVYKIDAGRLKRSQVKLGLRNTVEVEVVEGVAERDLLADGNLYQLKDGQEVVTKDRQEIDPE